VAVGRAACFWKNIRNSIPTWLEVLPKPWLIGDVAKTIDLHFFTGCIIMTNAKNHHETTLRQAFRTMNPDAAQDIREAYYKAVEGLRTLADGLEIEDAKNPGPASASLMHEHLLACQAIEAMDGSVLGRIL
jgi:hypothetical protein